MSVISCNFKLLKTVKKGGFMNKEDTVRTSVTFSKIQMYQIEEIRFSERFKSNTDLIRVAWDYFVKNKYPQLLD